MGRRLVPGIVAEMFRRGRFLGGLLVAAGLIPAVLGLTGCGADVPGRGELVQAFEDSGLSPDLSRCVSDALLKNLPDEDLIRLVEGGQGSGPRDDPDRDDDPYDLTRAALTKCQEQDRTTTTTITSSAPRSSTTAPTGSDISDSTSTTTQ
jgi:hypothetical protein